jgi:PAS domain S-box-containing protein
MAATLRERAGGWRRLVMDEGTRDPQGRRRVVLLLYLLLSPIGIAASLALGARGGYGPVIAKALVLLAAICWLLVRRTLTRVEWIVLVALVPAFICASSAWMAGPHADDAFIVSMVALTCIIAAIADWPVVVATVVLQLCGFAIVQFHQESDLHALATTLVAAVGLPLASGLILAVATDLRSSRAQLQTTLADAETVREQYRTLVEQMPAVICRFDVNRRVMLYTSPQIEWLTGEPASSWVGAEGYARWSSSMIGATQPDWEQLGRENLAWQNRYQWRRADGELRWFRSITRIVAPGVVQSIVFDATDDVERDQELAFEQRRYQTLVEQMPMVTLRADGDGVVEYVSPQIEELFGTTREQFLREINSEDWLEMIHPADRKRVADFVDLARDRGSEMHELELRVQTSAGEYRDVLLRRARVNAPETESGHYFHSVVIDISALRQAEARSRAAVDQLVRASEEEQARLAVELHDDTLQVMIAVLLQLQRVQPKLPMLVSAAEMLEGAIDRTRRLMFEIRPAALEREGLAAMISRVARDGPWLSARVDIAIERQSQTVEALCYRSLRELIVNARKHSQARTLRVTGHDSGGQLAFSVADDGVGFDTDRPMDGSDFHVGLATVVERLRLAGGDVEIVSSNGAGTEIRMTLPAEPRVRAGANSAA